jgi:hypothetical protein
MSRKSSLPQDAKSVSVALTPDTLPHGKAEYSTQQAYGTGRRASPTGYAGDTSGLSSNPS